MLFGSDTRVVPTNIMLDRGLGPFMGKRNLGSELLVCSNAAYHAKFWNILFSS